MATFKFVVFLALLLVCQASFVQKKGVSDADDDDSDFDYNAAGKLLRKIVNIVTSIIDRVATDVKSFVDLAVGDNLDTLQKETVDVTRLFLSIFKSLMYTDLGKMKPAVDEGTNVVIDCLRDSSNEFVDVITTYWDNFTLCHNLDLEDLASQVSTLLGSVSDTVANIKDAAGHFDDSTDLKDIINVLLKIIDVIAEFNTNAQESLTHIDDALARWAISFVTCTNTTAQAWRETAQEKIVSFAQCARS